MNCGDERARKIPASKSSGSRSLGKCVCREKQQQKKTMAKYVHAGNCCGKFSDGESRFVEQIGKESEIIESKWGKRAES